VKVVGKQIEHKHKDECKICLCVCVCSSNGAEIHWWVSAWAWMYYYVCMYVLLEKYYIYTWVPLSPKRANLLCTPTDFPHIHIYPRHGKQQQHHLNVIIAPLYTHYTRIQHTIWFSTRNSYVCGLFHFYFLLTDVGWAILRSFGKRTAIFAKLLNEWIGFMAQKMQSLTKIAL